MNFHNIFGLKPIEIAPEIPEEEVVPHIHQWSQKLATYAAPRRDAATMSLGTEPYTMRSSLLGLTTILEECMICHETRKEEMLGTDHPPLDQLLDQAELFGPQYIQRNNITFLIQQYQTPAQARNQVPIR